MDAAVKIVILIQKPFNSFTGFTAKKKALIICKNY